MRVNYVSYQDNEENHIEDCNKSPLCFHVLSYSSSAVINQNKENN